jgi:multisubunit Na+/H+ antiporter MnhC subunit
VFVAAIAYHGVWAAIDAVRAADDRNWSYAVEMAAIAVVATAIVVGAAFTALRSTTRTR